MDIPARLAGFREYMSANGLDGFVVPRADVHQSEVAAPRDDCLAYITGFTGSAGLALILRDKALIFVDGRYDIQVRREVDEMLFDIRHLHNAPIDRWMRENAKPGMRIGFDPTLVNGELHDRMAMAMASAGGSLVASADPFDAIWPDRPAAPLGVIRAVPVAVAGENSLDKRKRAGRAIAEAGSVALAETLPDNIAWLLNVRGSDVPMNPVPHSFLLIEADGRTEWYVDKRKLGNDLSGFELEGVRLGTPDEFLPRVTELARKGKVMIDQQFAPVSVRLAVEAGGGAVLVRSNPLTLLKAKKNDTELAGYRRCHIEDGAALTDFMAWVFREGRLREGSDRPLTELEAEAKLLEFRSTRKGFLEDSFRSISASGINAALCHYSAAPATNAPIDSSLPYLIDSGGQYVDGTTDVTRTLFLGPAEPEIRRAYTAVLKGFLSLISAQMPAGTQGHQLDAFARRPLWDLGLDYDHGTGHGVGHNMLVHEHPHRFSKLANPYGLEPGNIMTIEPGYYEVGRYGLRIENQVEVVAAAAQGFCRFKSLTLAPIDLSAVNLAGLTQNEIAFLDAYHAHVREALEPLVLDETRPFLVEQTRPIAGRS
ncbi:Xaa-Pro aminopeptidase [Brucella endophytica]|uniref:Xaa-Pro aminopeptidase n=1 Tax=Brucella endophytica TaxID=1963359 RepID=A0A916WHZ0_9HYPH|nr:aminopeptidase P family protein [Brucella endophytica]GGA99562.1 Xaa-Pro aminopeptidase [Brucella endophytica]